MKEYNSKILMLTESHFPEDVRIKNEAYTLSKAGYKITVIALRSNDRARSENIDGIQVYRVPEVTIFKKSCKPNASYIKKQLTHVQSIIGYLFEYCYFTTVCFLMSFYVLVKDGFDVIHAHNPPDTLFIIGAFYKLFGKKFVFDQHDLCPELYLSRTGTKESIIHRGLLVVENLCLKTADITIATNESYKEIEIERGRIKPENVYVVRNGPDLDRIKLVSPDERLKRMDKKILGYVGALNPQDGVDYLLRAVRYLVYELHRTDFYCVIIGKGDSIEDLKSLSNDFRLDDYVWFTGFVPDEDMVRYLSTADICVDPDPSSPLNDVSTWIKIMEFMALGKPIVTFDLKETRFTAQEAAIYVKPNDEAAFARAIVELMDKPDLRIKMGEYGRKRIEKELNWAIVSKNLLRAYASITA